jgi:hypothetical protein
LAKLSLLLIKNRFYCYQEIVFALPKSSAVAFVLSCNRVKKRMGRKKKEKKKHETDEDVRGTLKRGIVTHHCFSLMCALAL